MIVVGAGVLGTEVVLQLSRLGVTMVVVDVDPGALATLCDRVGRLIDTVAGDALDEEVLIAAGVRSATGFVSALHRTRDNLFLTATARQMVPGLRIVARARDLADAGKFATVGAASVVSPDQMGGERLAHTLLRPQMARFADALLATTERPAELRKLTVSKHCEVAGQTLRDARLQHRTGCVVLAMGRREAGPFRYQPNPKLRLKPGSALMVLGLAHEIAHLEALLAPPGSAEAAGQEADRIARIEEIDRRRDRYKEKLRQQRDDDRQEQRRRPADAEADAAAGGEGGRSPTPAQSSP